MKRKIISHGTHDPAFAKKCWESQRRYAESVDAEHIVVMIGNQSKPNSKKLEIIASRCGESDRVVYLDWDMEVSTDADDLFAMQERFCMRRHPAKKSLFFRGTFCAPWHCSSMMVGSGADFMALLPLYAKHYKEIMDTLLDEERATNKAANEFGIEITPIEPLGFIHHSGIGKYKGDWK